MGLLKQTWKVNRVDKIEDNKLNGRTLQRSQQNVISIIKDMALDPIKNFTIKLLIILLTLLFILFLIHLIHIYRCKLGIQLRFLTTIPLIQIYFTEQEHSYVELPQRSDSKAYAKQPAVPDPPSIDSTLTLIETNSTYPMQELNQLRRL